MAELKVVQYLKQGGATGDEVDDFTISKDGAPEKRFMVYWLWVKILSQRRGPYKKEGHFFFKMT